MPKTINPSIFHGWGFVDGHWVYIPLWDPSPIEKFSGYRQLHLASAIANISKQISQETVRAKLKDLTKELLTNVSKSSLASWEDGDGICPEGWPWKPFPHTGGGVGPDPDNPVYFPTDLSKSLKDQLAGHLLKSLASQMKHSKLQDIAKQLG